MKRIISLLLSTICTVMMISTLAFAAETSLEDTGVTVVRLNRREYDTLYVKNRWRKSQCTFRSRYRVCNRWKTCQRN